MPSRHFRALSALAASTTLFAIAPVVAHAAPVRASVSAVGAPKCFGKKPGYVLTGAHATLTLTAKNRNAVVDLLGKGETLNAGKAKGNTYVCDTGGARAITTGNGNDKVSITNGSPSVNTGAGNDTFIQTGTGNPVVHLGAGNDVGTLGRGNGTLYGDAGSDVLRAGGGTTGKHGRQHLIGGTGNDTLYAGKATATLDGSNPGTHYIVPAAYAPHTTVILRAGDTLNGKPYPTPSNHTDPDHNNDHGTDRARGPNRFQRNHRRFLEGE